MPPREAKDNPRIPLLEPGGVRIAGIVPVKRTIHRDLRGLLIETLRNDDRLSDGNVFAMTYTSVTVGGEYRDVDRWHVHERQTDRFIVGVGDLALALYDGRAESPTHGFLDVIRMASAAYLSPTSAAQSDTETYMLAIPPRVYHALGNLTPYPAILQNFPTELYNPSDEGRAPFIEIVVPELGRAFSWQ